MHLYGCRTDTLLVLDNPPPLIADAGQDVLLPEGSSVALSANSNAAVPMYSWNPPVGLSCSDCPNPLAMPHATQLYTLRVADEQGCTAADEVLIELLPRAKVALPNAFSPNDDGYNDRFLPVGGQDDIQVLDFRIFNRWGAMVYEETNVAWSQLRGWDGRLNNRPQPTEVYVYVLRVLWPDGKTDLLSGEVVLLR